MQIVNGYVCATSCDVSVAKRGHDPKNPHDDPVKAAQLALAKGQVPKDGLGASTPPDAVRAVQFGGTLSALRSATVSAGALAGSAVSSGPGAQVDRLA